MNLNKSLFAGNVTRDTELTYAANGTAVAKFSLAVNEVYYVNEEKKQSANFFDFVAFGKVAERLALYAKKGTGLFVESRARQNVWKDKETDKNRSKVDFTVLGFQFVGGKKDATARVEPSEPQETEEISGVSQVDDEEIPF